MTLPEQLSLQDRRRHRQCGHRDHRPAGHLHVNGAGAQLSIFQSSNNNAVQFRLQTNSINRRFVALNTAGQQQSQLLFGDNGAFDFLGPTAATCG